MIAFFLRSTENSCLTNNYMLHLRTRSYSLLHFSLLHVAVESKSLEASSPEVNLQ